MEHYYSEIRSYLPLYFPHEENQEFIDYLGQAYVKNIEGKTHHDELLYMIKDFSSSDQKALI